MITKITGETPFQVLTNNFSISPSNEGYTLQISADGVNFSNLFTVGAGVTRLVTGVAANSYYKLSGNQSAVSINWMKVCVTEGGGASGTELQPVSEFPLADEGTVVAYNGSASASGVYQYNGSEWVPVGVDDLSDYWTSAQTVDYVQDALSGVDLSNYYTKAETDSAITAVEDHLYDVEEVTASALTELHTGLLEVSARTVDLSGYYTSAQTEQAITSKNYITSAQAETQIIDKNYVTSAQVETQIIDKNYITSAYVSDALTAYTPTSGFSTINGSAITSGGNITIETPEMTLPLGYEATDQYSINENCQIVTVDGKIFGEELNEIPRFVWFDDGYSDEERGYVIGNGCYVFGYYDEDDNFVPVFLPAGTYAILNNEDGDLENYGKVLNLFYGKIGDEDVIYNGDGWIWQLDSISLVSPLFTITEPTCPTTEDNYYELYLDYKDNGLASQVEEIAQVTAGAINQLQSTKVGSEDIGDGVITKIVKIQQTPYDDLVNNDETDPETLYVVIPDQQ